MAFLHLIYFYVFNALLKEFQGGLWRCLVFKKWTGALSVTGHNTDRQHRNTAQRRCIHCIYKRWRDCIFTGIRNDYKIEGPLPHPMHTFSTTTYFNCNVVLNVRSVVLSQR